MEPASRVELINRKRSRTDRIRSLGVSSPSLGRWRRGVHFLLQDLGGREWPQAQMMERGLAEQLCRALQVYCPGVSVGCPWQWAGRETWKG